MYVWADGIHFNIRLEDDRLCTLVLLDARADGTKEVIPDQVRHVLEALWRADKKLRIAVDRWRRSKLPNVRPENGTDRVHG